MHKSGNKKYIYYNPRLYVVNMKKKIAFGGKEWEPLAAPVYATLDSVGRFYLGRKFAGRNVTAFFAYPGLGDERFAKTPIKQPACDILELAKLGVSVIVDVHYDDYVQAFWEGQFRAGGFGESSESDHLIFDLLVDDLVRSEVDGAKNLDELIPDVRDPDVREKIESDLAGRLGAFALHDEILIPDYASKFPVGERDPEGRIRHLVAMVVGEYIEKLYSIETRKSGRGLPMSFKI